jgi:Ca2+-binding EF-hand superfamily protein
MRGDAMICCLKAMAFITMAGGVVWAAPAFTADLETSAAARIQENARATVAMMDRNRDGSISKEEFFRHNANIRRFAQLDVDGDGALNAEEQTAVHVGPRILGR